MQNINQNINNNNKNNVKTTKRKEKRKGKGIEKENDKRVKNLEIESKNIDIENNKIIQQKENISSGLLTLRNILDQIILIKNNFVNDIQKCQNIIIDKSKRKRNKFTKF